MRWSTVTGLAVVCTVGTVACLSSSTEYPRVLLPCDDAAPLTGMPSPPSLGYRVELEDGADAAADAPRLASNCEFQVDGVSIDGDSFTTAELDLVALGCLRCDPAVALVLPNALLFPQ